MGRGPSVLAGDAELLEALGNPNVEVVPQADESRPEVARVFELNRRLAGTVGAAAGARAFPLVLAGNCISCLATTAGVGAEGLGVVWFDAHADFDTTEDNLSGFTDVMGLAILTGTGWTALRSTIPGFQPIAEENVVLAAVRDLEPYQRERLERSNVRTVPCAFGPAELRAALDDLGRRVSRVYLHFDLDAIDAGEVRANEYAAPGGPTLAEALIAIDDVFDRFAVDAAAVTAYDPAVEPHALSAARRVVARIADRAISA